MESDFSGRLAKWWPLVFVPVVLVLLGISWARDNATQASVDDVAKEMGALNHEVEAATTAARDASVKANGLAGRAKHTKSAGTKAKKAKGSAGEGKAKKAKAGGEGKAKKSKSDRDSKAKSKAKSKSKSKSKSKKGKGKAKANGAEL